MLLRPRKREDGLTEVWLSNSADPQVWAEAKSISITFNKNYENPTRTNDVWTSSQSLVAQPEPENREASRNSRWPLTTMPCQGPEAILTFVTSSLHMGAGHQNLLELPQVRSLYLPLTK